MTDYETAIDNNFGEPSGKEVLNSTRYVPILDRERPLVREIVEVGALRKAKGKRRYSEKDIERARKHIKTFQNNDKWTAQAFENLIAITNGETGTLDIWHEDDRKLQGKIVLEGLQLLYGVMRQADEEPREAARLAYIYYFHSHEESDEDRYFPELEWNQLREAIDGFDWGDWFRFARDDNYDEEDTSRWTGEYSDECYDVVLALIEIATYPIHPAQIAKDRAVDLPVDSELISCLSSNEYERVLSFTKVAGGHHTLTTDDSVSPEHIPKKVIREAAMEVTGRSKASIDNVINRLRRYGIIKWAEIEQGVDYRIYDSTIPDPPEANRIKFEGEEYVPEPDSERTDPELMADGGAEAKQDLERIRQARDAGESTETVETYTCPIDECSRTVIGDPANLRHHVKQSKNGGHRYRTLNEELEIVVHWDQMDWGPGVPKSEV